MPAPLGSWPLLEELAKADTILLAGAGGGFDLYSGLPLYFALRNAGKRVHLANLSFASLPRDKNLRVSKACVAIDADTPHLGDYFPELRLAEWFQSHLGEKITVYCFPQTGVIPLQAAYRKLVKTLELDAVVLVDGGTDSLMRGDEFGLGTPQEDVASLAAVNGCGVARSYLACIGFGIDTFHGICHAHFLEAVAELTRSGDFLGLSTVLPDMDEARKFIDAVDFANARTPRRESIVQNSIASSIEGKFGDHHRTARTAGSRLWINPMMPVYWAFNLAAVAERNLYLDSLADTESMFDITTAITRFRGKIEHRNWDEIPL